MHPTAGGGYTLVKILINRIITTKFPWKLFIIYKGDIEFESTENLVFLNRNILSEKNSSSKSLNNVVKEYNIHLVWFITPTYEQLDIPFIMTVWDLQHRLQPFFPEVSITGWKWADRENFYKETLPRASYIITGTERGKDEIMKFYNIQDERIKVIPFPIEPILIANNNEYLKIQNLFEVNNLLNRYIFYPAQFWPHKNHITLLKAVKKIKESDGIIIPLIFSGSDKGNLEYINQEIRHNGLDNQVRNLGFVTNDILRFLYENAFTMVFPSAFGPDNLPPLEAFLYKCPVIASDVPGAREQLKNGALFFNTFDHDELAEKILAIYRDRNIRADLILAGSDVVMKYNAQNYLEHVMQLFNDFFRIRECWSLTKNYTHL